MQMEMLSVHKRKTNERNKAEYQCVANFVIFCNDTFLQDGTTLVPGVTDTEYTTHYSTA